MKYIAGIDVGGTKCAVLLAKVDNGISVIDKLTFATETGKGFIYARDRIFNSLAALIERNSAPARSIEAIGVSCGGPLNSEKGVILSPPNLPGWDNIPFTDMLFQRFGIPAYLQNDANACALVEWKLGAGRGFNNIIFLTMGTGMGSGLISQGVLIEGANGMGGEAGHIRLSKEGPLGYGKKGSFEGFCSGGGIQALANEMTEKWIGSGKTPVWIRDGYMTPHITAKLIAEYADSGDSQAIEIFNIVGEKLGEGLSILVDILNPDRIVIGSIFARCGHLFRDAMKRTLAAEALPLSLSGLEVVPALLGESIGDYASIMAACYRLGISLAAADEENDEEVLSLFENLFLIYPELYVIKDALLSSYQIMRDTFVNGKKLLICGNGGSAADAGHIVGELMKGFNKKRPLPVPIQNAVRLHFTGLDDPSGLLQGALPAIDLTQHQALSTAFANDISPKYVFAQQVQGYGVQGDTLLAISTSGNAENCCAAALTAKAKNMNVISLTGPNGGNLAKIADCAIRTPGESTARIQEYHVPVYHTLCAMLEEKMF